ncbi:hypothetical protein HXX76_015930 [Chlamydomonas incerta]|uniref:Uncharacterized protein n=1 Tax=Chlamydomonas incerta TaxID=51695 RepID=A0A835SKX7_CHLIN|nr:hypothetical protein HXX76_015930 [Chlamydomonas incerta]|eukprot:KAG2422550.1 hypothetical protein HXX76_015930 [Chlamydomonas incerta]
MPAAKTHWHAPPTEFSEGLAKAVAAYSLMYGTWPPPAAESAATAQAAEPYGGFDVTVGPFHVVGFVDTTTGRAKVTVGVKLPWGDSEIVIGECELGAGGACCLGYKGFVSACLSIEGCSLILEGEVAGQRLRYEIVSWCKV